MSTTEAEPKLPIRSINFRYNTLADFLVANELSIDARLDDGAGAPYSVKGREIEATILFIDIAGFTSMTSGLSPTATLMFVNRFFTWITVDAFQNQPCIVDKYIGDEIMVVFSNEFGSNDHVKEAFEAVGRLIELDLLGYSPHIGIASGVVTVGYVGTPVHYDCSAFGDPVALAARCAGTKLKEWSDDKSTDISNSGSIIFTADLWRPEFSSIFNKTIYGDWEQLASADVPVKNMGSVKLMAIVKKYVQVYTLRATEDGSLGESESLREHVEKNLLLLHKQGRYRPIDGRKS